MMALDAASLNPLVMSQTTHNHFLVRELRDFSWAAKMKIKKKREYKMGRNNNTKFSV